MIDHTKIRGIDISKLGALTPAFYWHYKGAVYFADSVFLMDGAVAPTVHYWSVQGCDLAVPEGRARLLDEFFELVHPLSGQKHVAPDPECAVHRKGDPSPWKCTCAVQRFTRIMRWEVGRPVLMDIDGTERRA